MTYAIDIIANVALKAGDPNYSRIPISRFTQMFNKRTLRMSKRLHLIKWLAYFDIEAGNELYSWPDDMVQMTRLQYTLTPTNPLSYRDLNEDFEDEHRHRTNWNYPVGEPFRYRADQGFFYLSPQPTISVVKGGKIEYWGLAAPVIDPTVEPSPFAEQMRELLEEGMWIDVLWLREKVQEATAAESLWEAQLEHERPQSERRSNDRRSRLRTGLGTGRHTGQV